MIKYLIRTIVVAALMVLMVSAIGCGDDGFWMRMDSKPTLNYEIIIIDDCEYIKTYVYLGDVLEHKGNCKNPIHNKEK